LGIVEDRNIVVDDNQSVSNKATVVVQRDEVPTIRKKISHIVSVSAPGEKQGAGLQLWS
jgi:hypothetical protein